MKRNKNFVLRNRLKYHRELCDITQTELAKLCYVSTNTISSIEQGQTHPSVTLALVICTSLGVSLDDIFYIEPAFG